MERREHDLIVTVEDDTTESKFSNESVKDGATVSIIRTADELRLHMECDGAPSNRSRRGFLCGKQ